MLEVNPLIPADPSATNAIDYFCLENVPYHGQVVTILYDRDGHHYHKGTGLSVYVDGRQLLKPSALGKKVVPISAPTVTAPTSHPMDLAVNITRRGFPAASALHQ